MSTKSMQRLSLQLTPLLDLLLIVIFAQYLEIEQSTITRAKTLSQTAAARNYEQKRTQEELEFTKQVLAASQEFREQAEAELKKLQDQYAAETVAANVRQQQLTDQMQDVVDQRDRILTAIRQAYTSSAQQIRELLSQLIPPPGRAQTIDVERLTAELSAASPRTMALFLLAYEEIRKRCDLWELYLTPQGIVELFDGQQKHQFRAGSADEFQRQLFNLYKSLPQSKGLVILLVSYGEVRADLRQNVLLSLPDVTDRMRNDADGRTRFEYAVIGYLPETRPSAAGYIDNPEQIREADPISPD